MVANATCSSGRALTRQTVAFGDVIGYRRRVGQRTDGNDHQRPNLARHPGGLEPSTSKPAIGWLTRPRATASTARFAARRSRIDTAVQRRGLVIAFVGAHQDQCTGVGGDGRCPD